MSAPRLMLNFDHLLNSAENSQSLIMTLDQLAGISRSSP